MSFYTSFIRLCNDKGISPSAVLERNGIDRSAVTRWKNPDVVPSYKTIVKLADYFGVKVAELTGDAEIKEPTGSIFQPSETEKQLVYAWREATPKDRRIIEAVLSTYGFSTAAKKEQGENAG